MEAKTKDLGITWMSLQDTSFREANVVYEHEKIEESFVGVCA